MTGQQATSPRKGKEAPGGQRAPGESPLQGQSSSPEAVSASREAEHDSTQTPVGKEATASEKNAADTKGTDSNPESSLKQRVAVRFMQGRRGVQEDRHVVVSDLRDLAESEAKQEIDSWGASPASLVALFDGHRGIACSDFCASTFPAKLVDLLSRKLPGQTETKQGKDPLPPLKSSETQGPQDCQKALEGGNAAKELSARIPLSAASFTSPAPQEPPIDACCCGALRALLPSLPWGLQRLLPSLYHRLFSSFKQTDKEFIAKYKVKATAGCTAVAMLTLGRLGVVCWVGDSRAVAGVRRAPAASGREVPEGPLAGKKPGGDFVAVRLTEDHKPNRPDEQTRIEKAGGLVLTVGGVARVAPSDFQERTKRMKHEQCTLGGATQLPSTLLAVSRSFGDRDLKSEGLVSVTPEAVLVPLTSDLRFVVLACDGVWDALSDQEAVDIISAHLHDPDEATSKVVKAAFDRGSQDNLTAILVVFDSHEASAAAAS